ncbi:hypothetical protein FUT12_25710 [Bacillus mycoides]|uniref:phosphopantetheine-binding protein n=1 Tax=Bacillus mycoides TaxID=1405 RepID=UPI00187AF44A|nr:phosphopantetheine-binding protein [Bacillus mycoides]MBE7150859.1 hypothetical protein [Bacillus mycoides]
MVTHKEVIEIMRANNLIKEQVGEINTKSSLKEIGLDSLDIMMLLHEINNSYLEVKITRDNSIDDIVDKINLHSKNGASTNTL